MNFTGDPWQRVPVPHLFPWTGDFFRGWDLSRIAVWIVAAVVVSAALTVIAFGIDRILKFWGLK